jgi:hypothetical protein
MLVFLLVAGLGLALVLLIALHHRISSLPFALWSEARREREDTAPKALDAMKEAVAAKVGNSLIALQRYEDNIAGIFRAQVADAETRARVAERRAADTSSALQAATTLLRELREVLDAAKTSPTTHMLPPSTRPAVESQGKEHGTGEAIAAPGSDLAKATTDDEELGDDDKTKIGKRPSIPPPTNGKDGLGGTP